MTWVPHQERFPRSIDGNGIEIRQLFTNGLSQKICLPAPGEKVSQQVLEVSGLFQVPLLGRQSDSVGHRHNA
ncbi:MAG: Uncharacterised protein [Synechococcus sp. MIT S9220]|nr:MAG: Uncharacterised protein [Synechococcus sp. MIT S9220]